MLCCMLSLRVCIVEISCKKMHSVYIVNNEMLFLSHWNSTLNFVRGKPVHSHIHKWQQEMQGVAWGKDITVLDPLNKEVKTQNKRFSEGTGWYGSIFQPTILKITFIWRPYIVKVKDVERWRKSKLRLLRVGYLRNNARQQFVENICIKKKVNSVFSG